MTARGHQVHGIYKLDENELTLSVSIGGSRPPTAPATKAGGDSETFTLKRSLWKRHIDKKVGFTVDFPDRPTESARKDRIRGGKVTTTVYAVRDQMESLAFTLAVTPMPGRLDPREADGAIDSMQKELLDELSKHAKAKVESQRDFKAPGGISAAREVMISIRSQNPRDKATMRARLFVAGDRLFALTVSGDEDHMNSSSVWRFWNSFRPSSSEKRKDPPPRP